MEKKAIQKALEITLKMCFYILPGMTAYEIDRGSCWFTNSSFTHALNPVSFMYCKKREQH